MVNDFFYEYLCRPMIDPNVSPYNLVNYAVYIGVLAVIVVFFLYPFLDRKGIKFDFKFVVALLPFVLFGSSFRVLNDIGIFKDTCDPFSFDFYTFTPGIWFLTAALALISLFVAKKFSHTEEGFEKLFAAIGVAFCIPLLLFEFQIFRSWNEFVLVIVFVVLITLATRFFVTILNKKFFSDGLNFLAITGQVLDGSATFVATKVLRCEEQHPLSDAILGINPLFFVLIKIILALLIIYYLDKEIPDKNQRGFIKMVVIIFGFAPGLRDLMTIGAGTCI